MKKLLQFVVPLLLLLVIISSIGWYLFVFDRDFTRDMLLKEARDFDLNGNSRISAWFYNLAYMHSGQDENVAIELANQYKSDGNYTKAEVTLSKAINSGATAELYTALCRTYVEQDKLIDAVALLEHIPFADIKADLDAKRPTAPVADQAPGFYSQYIKLTLSSSAGTLLYTTNGEYPSITDQPFTEPFALKAGETKIYCISVDNSGLVSPLSIMSYTVGGVIEPAVFMDPAMDTAVHAALGVNPDTLLYTNDLWELKEFTVPAEATTLEDLALMPFLEKLTIPARQLDSLEDLASLDKLATLDLTGCRFPASALSIASRLPALTSLTLADCSISTIADLAGANGLTYLDISKNTVRNLDVLSDMSNLKELYLQHNALDSLAALKPLSNLERLDISYNSVTSLEPLAGCIKLNWLNAGNNLLTQVDGIAALPLLESLSINYNHVETISELSACLQLRELSMSNNRIGDITSLAGLTKLEVFDFSYNAINTLPQWPDGTMLRIIDGSYNMLTDITVLGKMSNLTYVSLDYNQLTDVNPLENCNNLVQVNVYGNAIPDVSALTAHNIIVNYDPTAE